jgi:serine/threonine protein kinase
MVSRLRKSVLPSIIPRLVPVFGGKLVCGHTPPDQGDNVHFFEFCEFVKGSFRESFALATKEWSEHSIFTDALRHIFFVPLVHSLYFLGEVGFSVLDIKPDNIRINEKNELVFTDLGLGVVHSPQFGRKVPLVLKPRNRTNPTQYSSTVRGKKLNGFNGQLHFFTAHDIMQMNDSNHQSYPCLGVGTKGLSDNSKRGLQNKRTKKEHIEKSDAVAEDMFQVAMTLLRYFNKPTSEDWQEKAVSAVNDGIDAMTNFMLKGKKNQGGGLPQPTAMRRYADLFCKWISHDRAPPGVRGAGGSPASATAAPAGGGAAATKGRPAADLLSCRVCGAGRTCP